MKDEFDLENNDEFDLETPVETAAAPDSLMENAGEAVGGAIGGGLAGTMLGIGAEKTGTAAANLANKFIDKFGALNPEQMKYITADPKSYRAAPELSQALNEYRDIGQGIRQKGFTSKNAAIQALEGAEDIPVEVYHKALGKVAEKPKYSNELPAGRAQVLQEQRMSEVRPDIDAQTKASNALDAKMSELAGQQYVSPHQSKIAELEQLLAAPKANVPFEARQKAQGILQDRRLQRINEDLNLNPENRKLNNKKEDFLLTKKVNQEKTGTIKGFSDQSKLESMQKELADLKALQESGSTKAAAKQKEKIEQMLKNKTAIDDSVKETLNQSKAAADTDLDKEIRTPEAIRKTNPEYFNQRILDEELASSLDEAVKAEGSATKLSPKRIAERVLPRLRDGGNYDTTGASSLDKLNTDVAEGTREWLGEKFPEYDKNMKASAEAIATEEKLLNPRIGGLQLDKTTDKIVFPDSSRKNIGAMLSSNGADKFVDEQAQFKEMLKGLPVEDQQKYFDQLKAAAIKQGVKDTEVLRLTGYDVGNAMKGSPTAVAKPLLDTFKTKIQEGVALSRGDGVLKTAGEVLPKIGKALPGILGAGGAILGATSAAQAGELSPVEASVAGAADILNPLPLDTVAGAVGAKKGYAESIEEQKMTPEYFEEGGDVSQSQALLAGAKGGAKGLVQPLVDLGQAAGQAGTEKSLDARSRMEQQMKALEALKPKEPKKGNDFLNFVDKNPEALKQLAGTLQGASQSYAGPLMKAAEADERSRAAILFGLYQQPAFRSLIGEGSLINNNIPGVKKSDS